jgi:hypothetical protein
VIVIYGGGYVIGVGLIGEFGVELVEDDCDGTAAVVVTVVVVVVVVVIAAVDDGCDDDVWLQVVADFVHRKLDPMTNCLGSQSSLSPDFIGCK